VSVASDTAVALARCHGFLAVSRRGPIGEVETPLFASDRLDPDYLVVRLTVRGRTRRPLVPIALVERVDELGEIVYFRDDLPEVDALPEHLPLVAS
jgi:hypothetical protein